MLHLKHKPWFRRLLVTLAGKKEYKKYFRQSFQVQETQERLLQAMLTENKDTVFGRKHNFAAVRDYREYCRAVPVMTYEDHRPYIEKMCRGKSDILFPGRPLIYNRTSGTTNKPKLIPISPAFFRRGTNRVNKLWLYAAMKDNPGIYNGKCLSYVAPAVEGYTEDGTPFGSVSGLGMKNIPAVLKDTYSAPYAVMEIKNYERKFYALMRFALAQNITLIIALNPATYLRFNQTIMNEYGDLLRDIRDGTMRADVSALLPPDRREQVLARLKPDPARAGALEKLRRLHGSKLRFRHYWPGLELVNIWKQGNFRQMLHKLDGFFPEKTVYRAFGYQASEARCGIVLGNDWDYSALATHAFFFEFIEADQKGKDNPATLRVDQLEKGKKYYLLLNNLSGLYRYDMNDLIEVCGFYNQVPLFRFLQKGEGITNLTGEKLSEQQVIAAVAAGAHECGWEPVFYIMYCDYEKCNYEFFAEFSSSRAKGEKFIKTVDCKLKSYNMEWETKRGTGRLSMPRFRKLPSDSQLKLKQKLVEQGLARDSQFKNLFLTGDKKIYTVLQNL